MVDDDDDENDDEDEDDDDDEEEEEAEGVVGDDGISKRTMGHILYPVPSYCEAHLFTSESRTSYEGSINDDNDEGGNDVYCCCCCCCCCCCGAGAPAPVVNEYRFRRDWIGSLRLAAREYAGCCCCC